MRNFVWYCAAAVLLCLLPALADAAPVVYPVREVFGFKNPKLKDVAPIFGQWVEMRTTKNLENEFDAAFRKEFGPLAAENVTDVNKHEVLVASLHLIRASQYAVPKLGNYEVHLPLTLSIVITNPANGDVIYAFTKTSYTTVLLASPDADTQARSLLLEKNAANYAFLLQTLIKEARQGYNPSKIDITVATVWNGLSILDKGSKSGIAQGDNLVDSADNELSVKYVAEDYAVATTLLGSSGTGKKFFKFGTASTASQFNKPRVLTMREGWGNPDLANISNLFDSELSKESAFTLLPVNEYFRKLLEALARDTYSGKFETTQQRAVPDYLMKFSATEPRAYTMSEKGNFSKNVYEQYVLGELLDKQGRIIFSAVGADRIEDKNVGGMVFSKEARLEVLQKNAVVNLAEQFARSIKFSRHVHRLEQASGNQLKLTDKSRELRGGQEVTLYRNVGNLDGIGSKVLIPIWLANVVEAQQGAVTLELSLPLTDKGISASSDDMVIVDAVTAAATADQSETSVTYCSNISPKLGSIDINDFGVISRSSGYLLPYTLYDGDAGFRQMVQEALRDGGFKDTLRLGKVDTAGRCLQPVHKVTLDEKKCEKGYCSFAVSMALGYRLYAGTERKAAVATNTKITIEDCRETSQEAVIQGDLSKHASAPLKSNILKMHY